MLEKNNHNFVNYGLGNSISVSFLFWFFSHVFTKINWLWAVNTGKD